MLTHLSIQNYALIENISVNFNDRLSVITGETGAGKSILLGALGLALGKRADTSTLKNKDLKCIIEAHFSISHYNLNAFFQEHDFDYEPTTIIRREILPGGKSRAFINDTPTTLQVLQKLSSQLIDIHSQHQSLELSDTNFQFKIIDALAATSENINSYSKLLTTHRHLSEELKEMREAQEQASKNYEYDLHLFEELEKAQLKLGEKELLEEESKKLTYTEEINQNLTEILRFAYEEEIGAESILTKITKNTTSVAGYLSEFSPLEERMQGLKIEFDDLIKEIENLSETIEFNETRLEEVNERLQWIYALEKKHNVEGIDALLEIFEALSDKVQFAENSTSKIEVKEKELLKIQQQLDTTAKEIHEARKEVIPELIAQLEEYITFLGMENSRFQCNLEPTEHYFSNGKDNISLQISADKGVSFGALKKVASGGELSRIMLSVKAILSGFYKLPTIIFDEIDTGISGEISQKMGTILRALSKNMQVITITHLPQIAAKGQHHFKVYKSSENDGITTRLKKLSHEERIHEIAEILGGKNITPTAVEHAKQLLTQ